MFRLPAVMFPALFFVIPAAAFAQIALVWFTPNVQDGQTFTAIRSIAHPFGQVASPFLGETSSGLRFASLLFQPQFLSVRMGLLESSLYAKYGSFDENFCLIFRNHRPILLGFPDQLVA